MNAKKACLFGGALLSAGIASQAQGQQFQIQNDGSYAGQTFNTLAYVEAGYYDSYGYGLDSYAIEFAYNGDDLNVSTTSAFGGTTTSTAVTNTSLRFESSWDGTGYGGYFGGFLQVFFTVTEDAYLNLSWDMSETDFFGPPSFLVIRDGALFEDLDVTESNPTGTAQLVLEAGVEYGISLSAGAPFIFDSGTKFLQAELSAIPTPGAAGLLAMAGIAAARRRRA